MHVHHMVKMWLVVFIPASVTLEIGWFLLVQRRTYPWRELLASVGVYVVRMPVRFLAPVVLSPIVYFVWSHRIATVPLDTLWGLALLFLGEEFAYYWMHRSAHEIRWLWASHVVHHTPQHIHLASAFRLGATELASGSWLFRLPLYFLGLNPLAVAGMSAINLFYQFWLHTDLIGRLGPIEWVFNTPSHHRVHHASNPEYLDRNYGGILIVFDRLFGTFARERQGTKIVYGLVHPIGSLNPLKIVFNEWALMIRDAGRARSWQQGLRLLFGRPGAARPRPSIILLPSEGDLRGPSVSC